jgi:hypothetical protein
MRAHIYLDIAQRQPARRISIITDLFQLDFSAIFADYKSINGGDDITSELRRFRELIAKNREQRLILSKNLEKVSRQLAKTRAHARDAIRTSSHSTSAAKDPFAALKNVYRDLCAAFQSIQPRNASAEKTFSRLILRCQTCIEQDLTPEQHLTQLEGIRFEYLLVLRIQGADQPQASKYAAIEDFIALIEAALKPHKPK